MGTRRETNLRKYIRLIFSASGNNSLCEGKNSRFICFLVGWLVLFFKLCVALSVCIS